MRHTTAASKPGTFHLIVGASVYFLACSSTALQKPIPDAAAGTGGMSASGGASGQGGAGNGGTSGGTGGSGGATSIGSGGTVIPAGGTGGTPLGATGGKAGSVSDAAVAGGAGGRQPDAGLDAIASADATIDVADAPAAIDGGTVIDGGWGDVGSALADFCVGSQSKVLYKGKTYEAPATSKWTDPFLSCCQVYAARVHTSEVVGKDFEVVVRMQGNLDNPGVVPVRAVGDSITAMLRTDPPSDNGGLADDPMMTGAIYIGGQPFGSGAWTLGACVSIDDPASAFAGTRVYVPGVPVAPQSWASRLRFLPFKDTRTDITSVTDKALQSFELGAEPLLDLMDIDFVDSDTKSCSTYGGPSCSWVAINSWRLSGTTLASKVTNTAPGTPFVVEADGERIYLGDIQSINSAWGCPVARIQFEDIRGDGFPIYAPPSSSWAQPDLRHDPRIVKVLTEAGKLIP
jgi:hypothetical protein